MAKLSNAIKKMQKLGEVKNDAGWVTLDYKGYHLIITENGRPGSDEIATISTCSFSLAKERDSMSDYFPECYHNNVTQAIAHIERCAD